MAEQAVTVDNDKIKEIEEKDALKRMETIKKLVPKSVNDTLKELKLSKYASNITTNFSISEEEVINKLKTEWDNYLDTNKPTIDMTEYLDNNKCFVWHSFWDSILNSIFIYCKTVSNEIFSNSSNIQLCNALNGCLCVCTLLDVLMNKKPKLILNKTVINNINLQNIINKNIGTKLDIEKWKQNKNDDKKIYKQYSVCLQKEAQKTGKGFVKLYKIHKLKQINEKKQKREEQKKKKQTETETKQPTKEPPKEIVKEEIKEEPKEERKEEAKQETKEEIKQFREEKQEINNENMSRKEASNSNMKYVIMFIIIIIAVLFRLFSANKK